MEELIEPCIRVPCWPVPAWHPSIKSLSSVTASWHDVWSFQSANWNWKCHSGLPPSTELYLPTRVSAMFGIPAFQAPDSWARSMTAYASRAASPDSHFLKCLHSSSRNPELLRGVISCNGSSPRSLPELAVAPRGGPESWRCRGINWPLKRGDRI